MRVVFSPRPGHALTGVLVETHHFGCVGFQGGHALTGVLVETSRRCSRGICLCHALTGVLVETGVGKLLIYVCVVTPSRAC